MICQKILGNLSEDKYKNRKVEYVDIEWHDAFSRIHKKVTPSGIEVGIQLGNEVLTHGIRQGDVLYEENSTVIAVNIPSCEAIVATVEENHSKSIAKLCYEIGNRHATLFYGDDDRTFITPYNEPMLVLLNKIHEVSATVKHQKLDFTKAVSSSINAHTH